MSSTVLVNNVVLDIDFRTETGRRLEFWAKVTDQETLRKWDAAFDDRWLAHTIVDGSRYIVETYTVSGFGRGFPIWISALLQAEMFYA